jgi:TusA-related sulfurtransferase
MKIVTDCKEHIIDVLGYDCPMNLVHVKHEFFNINHHFPCKIMIRSDNINGIKNIVAFLNFKTAQSIKIEDMKGVTVIHFKKQNHDNVLID